MNVIKVLVIDDSALIRGLLSHILDAQPDIEVVGGLNDGDQIIIGSYKVIKTIRNSAPVKVDNRIPVADIKS